MADYPTLETERLTLRRFRLTDVDDVIAFANDEEWQRYLPLPYPYERVHGEQFVAESFLKDWKSKPAFAVVLDDMVIGEINLSIDKRRQTAGMGYGIARQHWGNGYATEAARAVVAWAFEALCIAKVYAYANVDNSQSWRVMERIGMIREGLLRSEAPDSRDSNRRQDVAYYGILREEWERQT
ncbi:MAG: GNAT family N-acetyltransferase [Chloroflexi bacterium]|nr:GNAT family N-acetyltransferase [Chloroflexota bacterium]